MASTKFINECKNGANSNRLGKISVETIKKVSGTKLELSKTLDKKISPKLYGITKQNVYSGKQLLDTDILSYSFEANTNGYVGGATATRVGFGKVILNANTKYYISYDVVETGTTNVRNTPMLVPVDGSAYSYQYIGTYNTTTGRKVWEFTPVETKEYIVNYWCNTSDKKVTIANMMVSTDSDISYEPYVGGKASPNPDYPQEIEVATGSVSVKSTGKNLYVSSNDIPTGYYAGGWKDVENMHDGDVSINTASAWSGVFFNLKELIANNNLKVGDKVTCSIYFKTNFTPTWNLTFSLYRATLAGSSETITISPSEIVVGEWRRLSFSFEINEYSLTSERARIETNYYDRDDKYYFGNDRTNYMWFASPQFEVGELTDYEPYKESSITYDLGDNFFADKDYIENGVLNKNIGKVVLNGTEEWAINQTTTNHISFYTGFSPYKDIAIGKSDLFGDIRVWGGDVNNAAEEAMWNHNNGTSFGIKILKSRLVSEDVAGFKQWLSENLVTIYYKLKTPEQIQLETTGELRTFEPNTIITNDLDSEMEVEYSSWDTEITNSDNLTDVSVEDSCYVDGQIIGTTYAKKATSQLIAMPNDVDLLDKKIKVEIGVKYANLSNEMVKMGNYTIERPKDEQTENFTQITAYDDFNLLDNPYVCNLDFSNDITIADFYIDMCNQLKLSPMKTTFLNSDIKVTANPFVNKETLRVVLQEIEKVSCTFSEIDYETNKIDLVWLSENEEPDYEFATSDYTTLEGGKITYGPVNCLVIKESQIEGENTVRQDDDSIKTNGETQIAIQDSYFLFTQALREQAIDNIWNRVKGLTYVDCKLTTSYGKPFLKVGKKIRVNVNDGRVFDTYVLKHTFKYDGTFESIIESPALTKQETKVKSKSISESIRLTEIKVDKAEGKITATTKKIQEIETDIKDNYYSKTNVNELIQTAETGVTNTFSEAGGNNEIRNSSLWFKNAAKDAEENPYEFWKGKANEGNNDKATNYRSILLGKGSFIHDDIEVPNGNYSISFYYRKLISNAVASVVINGKEYPLDSLETKQFYTGEQDSETGEYIVDPIVVSNNHIKIEFKCDVLDGMEVYDLMCNKGTVKLAYSQNQNETTTDTVNISKGITITSSVNENTKFKADYDGIRILDGNNNPKTTFTDKGTETDELVVRKKATITGLLHQEVDDQTWVTKI